MSSDAYRCRVCGRPFKFKQQMVNHRETAHQGRLTDYDDSGELSRLDGMSRALRKNDYDKSNDSGTETTQRTLRNERVNDNGHNGKSTRQKTLNNHKR